MEAMANIQQPVKKSERVEQVHEMINILTGHQEFASKRFPVRSNWASKAGHPCERYLYYMRHDWDKAETRYWGGVGILGNLVADWWKRYMAEKGFRMIHDQLPLSDEMAKKYQIGGRIDGRIGWGDISPVLYEFKTMDRTVYDKINTYEDFENAKSDYIRGYPAQLQLYLLSLDEEAGLFVLCNKQTLAWKMIPVYLDYGYTEWLLKRLERVNKANEEGKAPERIGYGKTCERCDFKAICLPDILNDGLEMVDNDHLQMLIEVMSEAKPESDRYKEAKEEADDIAKKVGKDFIVGTEWKAEIKTRTGTRIDTKKLPIEERGRYEVPTKTTTVTFIPLGKVK